VGHLIILQTGCHGDDGGLGYTCTSRVYRCHPPVLALFGGHLSLLALSSPFLLLLLLLLPFKVESATCACLGTRWSREPRTVELATYRTSPSSGPIKTKAMDRHTQFAARLQPGYWVCEGKSRDLGIVIV
jgi:hypothetical protein